MSPTRLVTVPADEGLRLDQLLAARTNLSRRAARSLIASGVVSCNGRALRIQSRPMAPADVVDLAVDAAELGSPPPYPFPEPSILLETPWLVIADKPAGVLSQSAEVDDGSVPFDQRVALEMARRRGRPTYCRLVHRLDRVTSGVVLFAARREAHKPLTVAWREDRVERLYLAVVQGEPEFAERELLRPIARDPGHQWRFRCHDSGRAARTRVRVLARGEGIAAVACRLDTGRTHQVRVHLAEAGHPVLGDRLYGAAPHPLAPRPLLHALTLRLPDPGGRGTIEASAPLPTDLAAALPPDRACDRLRADPASAWLDG